MSDGNVDVDDDTAMDAPLISTLTDDGDSPPPQTQPKQEKAPSGSQSNAGNGGSTASGAGGSTRKLKLTIKPPSKRPAPTDEPNDDDDAAPDEEEDQEDQLIDDSPIIPVALPSIKLPARKRPRTTKEPKEKAEKKGKDKSKAPSPGSLSVAASVAPSEGSEHPGSTLTVPDAESVSAKASSSAKTKRGSGTRKSQSTIKTVAKAALKLKTAIPALPDDSGALSEGFTGTAASSPVTQTVHSPEPSAHTTPTGGAVPSAAPNTIPEDLSLDGVPIPVYPLPSKPFPVQPAPKIPTGTASVPPLDRSGKKVRHWRVARREIRGIGGGRWFAQTWVGNKKSEYHDSTAAAREVASLSVASGKKKMTGVKTADITPNSGSVSASGSVSGSAVRAPTKMRTIVAASDTADTATSPLAEDNPMSDPAPIIEA